MLDITQVDHLGIRISDIGRARAFYGQLGFTLIRDAGFTDGHPVIMKHPSGVVVNLLGPSTPPQGSNILMDADEKYAGYTHAALRVESMETTLAALDAMGIEITGGPVRFNNEMQSLFIRDPDRNVIELTEHTGRDLKPEGDGDTDDYGGYQDHP
jgi:catechol 2,3-dioxygenase-like lactoylglutathione lyase family enzyme